MSSPPARQRLFVALWPTAAVVESIEQLRARLPPLGRRVPSANMHLTVKFLGDVFDCRVSECVRALAAMRSSAFEIRLDCLGSWRRSGILWLGSSEDGPGPADLARRIDECLEPLGFACERRAFRTHLTLARKFFSRAPKLNFESIQWRIDRFALVRSQLDSRGARYATIGDWPLTRR